MKKTVALIVALLMFLVFPCGMAFANGHTTAANKQTFKTQKQEQKAVRFQVKAELKTQLEAQKQLVKQANFSDCINHWAQSSIEEVSSIGLFNGYPDGKFQPNKPITQAEMMSLLIRLTSDEDTTVEDTVSDEELNEENVEDETISDENAETEDVNTEEENSTAEDVVEEDELSDVPDWAEDAVSKAAKRNIINLNRFHSAVQASRAQSAVWIAKALGLEPVDTADIPFKDGILISQEDLGYIIALYNEGIIQGTPEGKFNPNSGITRAEMATIMLRLLQEQTDEDVVTDTTDTTDTTED